MQSEEAPAAVSVRKLLSHDTHHLPLFKRAAARVERTEVLLDVGAGIRPQQMVYCKQHVCVEPHGEYADLLEQKGYAVLRTTAVQALLRWRGQLDTIIALDVIEHMARAEGERFRDLAQQRARQQVVVFTPLGFMKQECDDAPVDPWGMQGQLWQTHRSGWTPADFPGWECFEDKNFNDGAGAFFAIWHA